VTFCLDSWAVLAWLRGEEPAAGRVDDALARGSIMSWINAGEVFYTMYRHEGPDRAGEVLDSLRLGLTLDDATPDRVVAAASIKARYPMSYADAFLCATALAYDATVLTGDDEILNAAGGWQMEDIRVES
jgi:predicted nucleic acid-binding protein